MKRINNLFDIIASTDNIRGAIADASKGKSRRKDVIAVNADIEKHIEELHQVLIAQVFINSPYETFEIEAKGKNRIIYKLPFFPDRVLHHCIVRVLQPIWIKQSIRDTYSSIPGRGVHDGVNRLKSALRDSIGTKYCLKIDIKKFYPSVNHDALKRDLRRTIKDEKLLSLLDVIINSAEGIPIGNYVSQWFGNIYLSRFDHYAKEVLKAKYYFRYCDDIVVLASNKEDLHDTLSHMRRYLSENLFLTIKENYQIFPVDARGIDFLGYRFFHRFTLVRKRIINEFKRKHRTISGKRFRQSMASYHGWFLHANTRRLTLKYKIS
jgi:retron-type reverse transcriptase